MNTAPIPMSAYESDTYRLLMEQVIAGNGLNAVVNLLSDLLGLPAIVADEEFQPLHAHLPGGRQLTALDGAASELAPPEISFDLSDQPGASTAPPTIRRAGRNGGEFATAPIVLPDGVVGYVWVFDPSGQLSWHAESTVSHAAAACAMEMVRQRAMVEGETRVRNSFLEDLLVGSVTSVTVMRRRAKFLGYELRGEQAVFVLDMDQFVAYIAQRREDESGIQRIKRRFRRSVDASLPAVWSRALLWEHSDSIVALAPAGKVYDTAVFQERVETLRAAVQAKLAGPSISAGIGRPSSDLTRLRNSYQEAEHALMIGAAISGPATTTAFDHLGAYRLLFYLREQPELEMFCQETLGALIQYDAEHNSRLLETLSCFLDLQGNLSRTARALHLHRNGLLYRINRIETIGRCDLTNSSQRLALQLALLARPLLKE